MTSAPIPLNQPNAAAVRAQVERMTASTVFRNSPQLATFLWFIVEAQLRGKAERLKGYTIGVEVLRRDSNFDPQLDPIVRVEATRLRRALERYYAGPGADDAIMISLPRGGYAPRIGWRSAHDGTEDFSTSEAAASAKTALLPGNGMPTLRVAPFVVIGTPQTRAVSIEALGGKLAEAFALFDIINILAAAPPTVRTAPPPGTLAPPAARSDYRLDGVVEYRGETVDLRFRLIDESDATVIWSRSFEGLSCTENCEQIEQDVILRLATTIVQPFGVISANDRAKRLTSGRLDMRYCCLLEAGDALRTHDPAAHVRVREGLEHLVALDPNFANGHTTLAIFSCREHFTGIGVRPGEGPPLDRALKAVRRGIELRPQSARGYHVLFNVLFFLGENEGAIATAEKAMALNRYDLLIPSDYGGRLICAGQIERGMEILRKAVEEGGILLGWYHFYLFVAHYARNEWPEARYQAAQITSDTYVYGQLARAIAAHRDGDAPEAERAVKAIVSAQPSWRDNPRREIGKSITAPDIADRLTADLIATGYLR
jgi:tetratricopeptide (TPR) repeat protein